MSMQPPIMGTNYGWKSSNSLHQLWMEINFGRAVRRSKLKEIITQERIDIVGLQETITLDFSNAKLQDVAYGFQWCWLPAKGKSGGILMGVKTDLLEIELVDTLEFCIHMTLRNRLTNIRFSVTTVYVPLTMISRETFSQSWMGFVTRSHSL